MEDTNNGNANGRLQRGVMPRATPEKMTFQMTLTWGELTTLYGLLDGVMGSSCDDEMNEQMTVVSDKLERVIKRGRAA